jgi:hypothetical protein
MKGINHRIFLSSLAVMLAATGCQPRGESHTLEQILSDARNGYTALNVAAIGDTSAVLNQLKVDLDKLAGLGAGGDAKELAGKVSATLGDLAERSGFTVRPAMSELMNQYKVIAAQEGAAISIGAPNLQLLVARTFSLLTTELSTSKFSL